MPHLCVDPLCMLILGRSWKCRIAWMGKTHQLKGRQGNDFCILVTWHNIYNMIYMGSKAFRILQCSPEAGSSQFIMKQFCLVLFFEADLACGGREILRWTMLSTVFGSLSGFPVSLFIKGCLKQPRCYLGTVYWKSAENLELSTPDQSREKYAWPRDTKQQT